MELSIVGFMDNEKPNTTPQPNGSWVPQQEYQDIKNQQVAEATKARSQNAKIRVFYTLLAVGGFLVAVAFIGSLIAPATADPFGSASCKTSGFEGIQFLLNLIGYPLLLATGILGATIRKATVRTFGIILIVLAPILGIFFFFVILASALCGV